MVRGPIEIERIIIFFPAQEGWVRKWWKFTYSGVFKKGRGKMAQQRHLERSP